MKIKQMIQNRNMVTKKVIAYFLIMAILVTFLVTAIIISFEFNPEKKRYVPRLDNNVTTDSISSSGYKYLQLKYDDIESTYSAVGNVQFLGIETCHVPIDAEIFVKVGQIVTQDIPIYTHYGELYYYDETARVISFDNDGGEQQISLETLSNQVISVDLPVVYYEMLVSDSVEVRIVNNGESFIIYEHMTPFYDASEMKYRLVFSDIDVLLLNGFSVQVYMSVALRKNVLLLDKRCTIALNDNVLIARSVSWDGGVLRTAEEELIVEDEILSYFIIKDNGCAGKYYAYYLGNYDWHLANEQ
ncbi:MAG: hypothetical protein LBF68_07850 [Christensenellaceae bacterium]|jgi:hypothetical protein|nr:hypothetical protein [Christensenellaceae bacterium]